jgi:hypothetical protein
VPGVPGCWPAPPGSPPEVSLMETLRSPVSVIVVHAALG